MVTPINYYGQTKINIIADDVLYENGDKGSCVMGMKITFKGMTIAHQIAQGSLTNELFFNKVIEYFVELGYDCDDFRINYGRMD